MDILSITARFTKLIDRTSKLSRASMDLPKIARLIYSLFVFIFRPILWNGWISDWKIFKRNFELESQRELQHIPCTNCVIFLLFNAHIYFHRIIPPNTVNFNPNVWKTTKLKFLPPLPRKVAQSTIKIIFDRHAIFAPLWRHFHCPYHNVEVLCFA